MSVETQEYYSLSDVYLKLSMVQSFTTVDKEWKQEVWTIIKDGGLIFAETQSHGMSSYEKEGITFLGKWTTTKKIIITTLSDLKTLLKNKDRKIINIQKTHLQDWALRLSESTLAEILWIINWNNNKRDIHFETSQEWEKFLKEYKPEWEDVFYKTWKNWDTIQSILVLKVENEGVSYVITWWNYEDTLDPKFKENTQKTYIRNIRGFKQFLEWVGNIRRGYVSKSKTREETLLNQEFIKEYIPKNGDKILYYKDGEAVKQIELVNVVGEERGVFFFFFCQKGWVDIDIFKGKIRDFLSIYGNSFDIKLERNKSINLDGTSYVNSKDGRLYLSENQIHDYKPKIWDVIHCYGVKRWFRAIYIDIIIESVEWEDIVFREEGNESNKEKTSVKNFRELLLKSPLRVITIKRKEDINSSMDRRVENFENQSELKQFLRTYNPIQWDIFSGKTEEGVEFSLEIDTIVVGGYVWRLEYNDKQGNTNIGYLDANDLKGRLGSMWITNFISSSQFKKSLWSDEARIKIFFDTYEAKVGDTFIITNKDIQGNKGTIIIQSIGNWTISYEEIDETWDIKLLNDTIKSFKWIFEKLKGEYVVFISSLHTS